jgi:hypothetical protein
MAWRGHARCTGSAARSIAAHVLSLVVVRGVLRVERPTRRSAEREPQRHTRAARQPTDTHLDLLQANKPASQLASRAPLSAGAHPSDIGSWSACLRPI